jgi:hypothetical protein
MLKIITDMTEAARRDFQDLACPMVWFEVEAIALVG